VFGEDLQTPHEEMQRVREMVDRNAFLANAGTTYSNIFIGNEFRVKSPNPELEEDLNQFLEDSGLTDAMVEAGVEHFKLIGNSYYHLRNGDATGAPQKVELLPRPELVWIRFNPDGEVKDYIQEVPRSVRQDFDESTGRDIETFRVSYGGFNKKSVQGIRYEPENIVHIPQGQGQIPPYGRSDLASAAVDEEILREIEKSYGMLARHKQVPRKMISMFTEDASGNRSPLNSEEFEDVQNEMRGLEREDNPLFNGVQVDVEDLSYGGANIQMQEAIDYLKRKITAPVGPGFLMHGDLTRNAVSEDQKSVFFLEVEGDRKQHKEKLRPVLRDKAEALGYADPGNFELRFGDLEFETAEKEREEVVNKFKSGLVTLNEARDMLDMEPVPGEDGDQLIFQLRDTPLIGEQLGNQVED